MSRTVFFSLRPGRSGSAAGLPGCLRWLVAVLGTVLFWTGGIERSPLRADAPVPEEEPALARKRETAEVIVYGGTSAGVIAAIRVAREGHTVILLEPGRWLGGLSSGGLGATDIGNKRVIGGLAREFYQRLRKYYDHDPAAWIRESREEFRGGGHVPGEDAAWTFEPGVAGMIFRQMLEESAVQVRFGQRLDLVAGVVREGNRIRSIRMENGMVFSGQVFIDTTYEGDLMALAGVKWTVGRESNAQYGETLNGVQTAQATKHQFLKGVNPFRVPGEPDSGLLPGIEAGGAGVDGEADARVQAYCFRLCTTDDPANRLEWPRPDGYDPLQYELLLRNFEAGDHRVPWNPVRMPNRKTDTNNNFAVSTDFIGMNYDYPTADYAARERMVEAHRTYQQGLLWTLANHERVPAAVRQHFQTWGLAADEFMESGNWPHQLYIREARRMVSGLVMTEHHCRGTERVADPVGMAAYTMDSHHVRRFVDEHGHVRNEGDVQVGGFPPYPVAWQSICPREEECDNLLVPVCLSASHIAFGSIRMEPVFMVLAESAALGASESIRAGKPLQQISYPRLRERMIGVGQVLE